MAFRHTTRTVKDAALGPGDTDLYVNIKSANRTIRPPGNGFLGTEWHHDDTISFSVHRASDDSDVTSKLSQKDLGLVREDAIEYIMTYKDNKLSAEGIIISPALSAL